MMQCDDPQAVKLLTSVLDDRMREKEARDKRIAELELLMEEFERLRAERDGEMAGKTGIFGIRAQLSVALLFRHAGKLGSGGAPVTLRDGELEKYL